MYAGSCVLLGLFSHHWVTYLLVGESGVIFRDAVVNNKKDPTVEHNALAP